VTRLEERDTPSQSSFGTGPVSTEPYVSAEFFEGERRRIFGAEWLNVARDEELPHPGDFVVRQIEAADASVLLVRGTDREVRAFHNVCSHRSNIVVGVERGSAASFRCRYHGWTYGIDGALNVVTAEDGFDSVDESCGLTPIHCAACSGFIFVNLSPTPAAPLRKFLGGWAELVEGFAFEECDAGVTMDYVLEANWKVAVDAFQETYHLGYLHRRTMRNMYFTPEDHSGSFLSLDFYGPHRRYSVWANPDYRTPSSAPVEQLAGRLARNINAGQQGGRAALTDATPGINPTGATEWCWDHSFVFPNTVVTFAPELWIVSRFWPLAIDRTRWENTTYYRKPTTASERFAREFGICHLRDVAAEDVATMEGSTRGLRSRAKSVIHLSDNEIGIRHFLTTVESYVRPGIAE
jgi:phenylpropionate dioxygenase-like ring-hydroxylating dioxygenase large terminal subunit